MKIIIIMYQTSYNKNWYEMSDNAIIDSICANLKQMRLNKNISQEELSSMSGVNRVTISRMESDRKSTRLNSSHLRASRMPSSA